MSDQTTQLPPASSDRRISKTVIIFTSIGAAVLGVLVALFAVLLVNSNSQVSSLKTELSQLQTEQAALNRAQQTAQSANLARLGVCWSSSNFTQNWTDGTSDTWVSGVSIDQPINTNGVYTCPQGDNFVSVVPASQSTAGG